MTQWKLKSKEVVDGETGAVAKLLSACEEWEETTEHSIWEKQDL